MVPEYVKICKYFAPWNDPSWDAGQGCQNTGRIGKYGMVGNLTTSPCALSCLLLIKLTQAHNTHKL